MVKRHTGSVVLKSGHERLHAIRLIRWNFKKYFWKYNQEKSLLV